MDLDLQTTSQETTLAQVAVSYKNMSFSLHGTTNECLLYEQGYKRNSWRFLEQLTTCKVNHRSVSIECSIESFDGHLISQPLPEPLIVGIARGFDEASLYKKRK